MRISDWSSDVCSSDLKTVVNDHVDIAARQFVALDEARELHRQPVRLAQPRGRIADLAGALQLFGADVEQRDARALQPHRGARIGRAHDRELDERSEEHTSELQSLMRLSYAVFCLKKKNITNSNIIYPL